MIGYFHGLGFTNTFYVFSGSQGAIDWVSTVADLVVAGAAAVGVVAAILGLRTWKSELRGRSKYDAAMALLKAVYMVREAIRYVRFPGISSGEFDASMREQGIAGKPADADFQVKAEGAVYERRWLRVSDAMAELDTQRLVPEILWGEVIKSELQPLRDVVRQLHIAIRRRLRSLHPDEELHPTKEQLRAVREILYGPADDSELDAFSNELQGAIARVEAVLKPHIM